MKEGEDIDGGTEGLGDRTIFGVGTEREIPLLPV